MSAARIRSVGRTDPAAADWVVASGRRLIIGQGRTIRIAGERRQSRFHVEDVVSDALLYGNRLLLVENGTRLGVLELDPSGPTAGPIAIDETRPTAPAWRGNRGGRLRIAAMGHHVVVAESGRGFSVLVPAAGHPGTHAAHRAGFELHELAFVPLETEVVALAATRERIFLADTSRALHVYDTSRADRPTPMTPRSLPRAVRAMKAEGGRLYLIGPRGLDVLELPLATSPALEHHPGITGSDIDSAGRTLYVGSEDAGVRRLRDTSLGGRRFAVTVGNNFFSPRNVGVDPGDTVSWTNASGFHNVASCMGQPACAGQIANETFTSGPPAHPSWFYQYTFQLPGNNPYFCVSHAIAMHGDVEVSELPSAPPRIPDGTSGTPLVVDRLDPDGSTLALSWDDGCPGAGDHRLLYGTDVSAAAGGSYALAGAVCSLGTTSPFEWSGVPAPDPGRPLWFVIVATDGAAVEGSWGTDGAGAEREGPGTDGSSGACGAIGKDVSNACTP